MRGTVEDFWGCMSPEVETFWASHGLYEAEALLRYLTPAITVIWQFQDDNAGVAMASPENTSPAQKGNDPDARAPRGVG
jgi:hypothetical protein